jgi:pimeloyl-ACP methyl ester carboxylesterase
LPKNSTKPKSPHYSSTCSPRGGKKLTYTGEYRFNIALLAQRLIGATSGAKRPKRSAFGYFGASTGAAAALIAAAKLPNDIVAVVSRGGRPDLAEEYLPRVMAPTLLLVGGLDTEVIELNRLAMDQMTNEKKLVIVPGATHLFEEPGALEQVAKFCRLVCVICAVVFAFWLLNHLEERIILSYVRSVEETESQHALQGGVHIHFLA